jgi:hypothetical protein
MDSILITFTTNIEPLDGPIEEPLDGPIEEPLDNSIILPIAQPIDDYISHPVDHKTDYFLNKHYNNEIKDKINFYLNQYYIHNRHEYIRNEDIYEYIEEKIKCINEGKEYEEDLYYYNIRNKHIICEDSDDSEDGDIN